VPFRPIQNSSHLLRNMKSHTEKISALVTENLSPRSLKKLPKPGSDRLKERPSRPSPWRGPSSSFKRLRIS
jgi:hypothetical protein